MLYHGPVRVASDAKPGNAKLLVRIQPGKGFHSKITEIPVKLSK